MREILFRGKHIHTLPQNEHLDGIWVYGYLSGENYINTIEKDEYDGEYASEMLVDPYTVCQYTGMTDRNGRKIFEGDIVEVTGDEERYAIEWDADTARFSIVQHGIAACSFDNYWGYELVVTGNIFDNPELLK